jgi:hypothetical protein
VLCGSRINFQGSLGEEKFEYKNGMESVYGMLYPMTQVDASVKVAHIEAIKNNHSAVETEPAMEESTSAPDEKESMICPRCGRALVARMAKKGANAGNEFYGCSGYPHCRYVKTK